ncbi:hypothetical protein Cni_G08567 [Canna indica]|uniref:Uncharacterized protein n=1 Tax=Canna indica TaxID=4628 RepID=A0AAQ3Q5V8_9LILI|nr:hypothetical protein Cni_G08567 [Canna indica]
MVEIIESVRRTKLTMRSGSSSSRRRGRIGVRAGARSCASTEPSASATSAMRCARKSGSPQRTSSSSASAICDGPADDYIEFEDGDIDKI